MSSRVRKQIQFTPDLHEWILTESTNAGISFSAMITMLVNEAKQSRKDKEMAFEAMKKIQEMDSKTLKKMFQEK